MARKPKQRGHRPTKLGPRIERRKGSPYWTVDGRFWARKRYTALRDPEAPGWPLRGERTTDEEVAERWKWKYKDLWEKAGADRQLRREAKAPKAIDDAVEAYLRDIEVGTRKVGERTWQQTANFLRNQLAPWLATAGIRRVDALSPEGGNAFLEAKQRAGVAYSTVFWSYRPRVSKFLRWLGHADGLRDYPLRPPADDEVRNWSDDEITRLFGACRSEWETRLLAVLLGTGVRIGEACALQWRNFDPSTHTVRVLKQLDAQHRPVAPKNKKPRTAAVMPVLFEHIPVLPASGFVLAGAWQDKVSKRLKALYKRAGLAEKGVVAHVWRHTYARLFMEETGGDLGLLCESLGNSFDVSRRYYKHFGADRAALLAVAKIYKTGGLRAV